MDIVGSFRVNEANIFTPNIQYALFFLRDRVLFIKIGGQFADFRYILGYFLPVFILGTLGGVLGNILINPRGQTIYLGLGMMVGAFAGRFKDINLSLTGQNLKQQFRDARDILQFANGQAVNLYMGLPEEPQRGRAEWKTIFDMIVNVALTK